MTKKATKHDDVPSVTVDPVAPTVAQASVVPSVKRAPKPASEGGPRVVSYTCGRAQNCEHACRVEIGSGAPVLVPVEKFHKEPLSFVIPGAKPGVGVNTYR